MEAYISLTDCCVVNIEIISPKQHLFIQTRRAWIASRPACNTFDTYAIWHNLHGVDGIVRLFNLPHKIQLFGQFVVHSAM